MNSQGDEDALMRQYEPMKDRGLALIRARLGARHMPVLDLEGFYNEAWRAAHERLRHDEPISNLDAFIVETAVRCAIVDARHRVHASTS